MLSEFLRNLRASSRLTLIGEPSGGVDLDSGGDAWLASLQGLSPLQACRLLDERIQMLDASQLPAAQFVPALVAVHRALTPILRRVDLTLPRTDLRFSEVQADTVRALLTLLKRISYAFTEAAQHLSGRWFASHSRQALESALAHGALAVLQRIEMAHRIYARSSDRCWGLLERLSGLWLANRRLSGRYTSLSVESLHARALLFALADPNHLDPAAFEQLRLYLRRHGGLAQIRRVSDLAAEDFVAGGLHALGVHGRHVTPLSALPSRALAPSTLVLDARQLLRRLERQLQGLEAQSSPQSLGLPRGAGDPSFQAFLRELRDRWSARRPRKHARNLFRPRARLVTGFNQVREFLARAEAGEEPGPKASCWSIVNESAAGLCLGQLAERPAGLTVGDLCCVQTVGRRDVHLALIRRAETRSIRSFQLGIELLGGRASVARVLPPARNPQPGAEVPAIKLTCAPRLAGRNGLVFPARTLRATTTVVVENHLGARRFTLEEIHPLTPGFEIAILAAAGDDSAGDAARAEASA